ncbi:hypothetical protein KUTeg_013529 [Tegillarca granosa]|uniref:CxC2-like cysteine cluster KDZ transposase-associated domain-containing protein n=1 Tax=Tegillarca granosa TaxID=220873 RepID=A0ABQ9EZ41_TEGGR|nr:hypothetical protein KUTeg_013529 [Tegillarca granosa]
MQSFIALYSIFPPIIGKMPIKRIKLTDKYKVTVYNGGRKKSTVRRAAVKMEKTQGLEMETVENPSEPCHFLTDTQDSLNDQSVAMYSNGGKTEYEIRKNKIIENWNRVRQVLVDTHIEELSPSSNECCMCKTVVEEIIYCDDCGPTAYYCQACCQRIHAVVVFHTPQIWKGSLYVPLPMLATFQRVDNHDCGTLYTSSIYAINGKGVQHKCTITLCKCEEPAVTLMRYRLWPATPQKPRIAFDLRFMEILSALQLECHMSAKSFCDAMESIQTDFIHISHDFPKNIYRAVVGDCLTEFNYHRSSIRTRHAVCENTFARECPICKQHCSNFQAGSLTYGQRYVSGTGLTDGEGIERGEKNP